MSSLLHSLSKSKTYWSFNCFKFLSYLNLVKICSLGFSLLHLLPLSVFQLSSMGPLLLKMKVWFFVPPFLFFLESCTHIWWLERVKTEWANMFCCWHCPWITVQTLRDIARTLGKTDWDFDVDPCSGQSGWVTPNPEEGSENSVRCNCTFNNNTSCHVVSM